jgi:aminopeptidase N
MQKFTYHLICYILLFVYQANAQTIDVSHIALHLKFDWQKKQTYGEARITLSPLKSTHSITLDAGMLSIESISLNEKKLRFVYDGGDKKDGLAIFFDKEYPANESITLKINYHSNYQNHSDPINIGGSFGKGLRFFEPTSTTPNKQKQLWSSGEPENNKYWFPCNENITDIHTTELIATVDKPLMVIGNGELIETIENKDNSRTFHYKSNKAFPNYLVSIVVGEYVDVIQNSKSTTLHNFG